MTTTLLSILILGFPYLAKIFFRKVIFKKLTLFSGILLRSENELENIFCYLVKKISSDFPKKAYTIWGLVTCPWVAKESSMGTGFSSSDPQLPSMSTSTSLGSTETEFENLVPILDSLAPWSQSIGAGSQSLPLRTRYDSGSGSGPQHLGLGTLRLSPELGPWTRVHRGQAKDLGTHAWVQWGQALVSRPKLGIDGLGRRRRGLGNEHGSPGPSLDRPRLRSRGPEHGLGPDLDIIEPNI